MKWFSSSMAFRVSDVRRYVYSRTRREQILLLTLCFGAVVIWLLSFQVRWSSVAERHRAVSQLAHHQKNVLANRDLVHERLEQGIRVLEPGRTLNSTQLAGELSNIARQFDLHHDIDAPRTQQSDIFRFHSVVLTSNRASLESLIRFSEAVSERSPYIGLERVVLAADRSNPALINARFNFSAVELRENPPE